MNKEFKGSDKEIISTNFECEITLTDFGDRGKVPVDHLVRIPLDNRILFTVFGCQYYEDSIVTGKQNLLK